MPVRQPYFHIYRHGTDRVNYPFFELYKDPQIQHYFASYEVLKKDLARVFEFIEPEPSNLPVYSHRLLELLLRASTEVESLFRLVFSKNGIHLGRNGNMIRYSDLEGPMHLSEYVVCSPQTALPDWNPFESFSNAKREERSPAWYRAYNSTKHDRAGGFSKASLLNVLGAIGGVYVLLVAQVGPYFDSNPRIASAGTRPAPRLVSHRQLPTWTPDEEYDFNWHALKQTPQPFQKHPIPTLP